MMTKTSFWQKISFSKKNTANKKATENDNPIISIIIAIVLAVVFRSFAFEPFNIPSGSMKPTLLIGDYVFVSKFTYGYSRYSFPLGFHFFDGRLFESKPMQGDVVVFKLPSDPSTNYVKRLIGMPGDKIQVKKGLSYINDIKVKRTRIADFIDSDQYGIPVDIKQYKETLPNGVSYLVLDETKYSPLDNTPVYNVPSGHYFLMGDNRDNSADSRVMEKVGFVPEENFVGPAKIIFFSSDAHLWQFWHYRKERYLKKINHV